MRTLCLLLLVILSTSPQASEDKEIPKKIEVEAGQGFKDKAIKYIKKWTYWDSFEKPKWIQNIFLSDNTKNNKDNEAKNLKLEKTNPEIQENLANTSVGATAKANIELPNQVQKEDKPSPPKLPDEFEDILSDRELSKDGSVNSNNKQPPVDLPDLSNKTEGVQDTSILSASAQNTSATNHSQSSNQSDVTNDNDNIKDTSITSTAHSTDINSEIQAPSLNNEINAIKPQEIPLPIQTEENVTKPVPSLTAELKADIGYKEENHDQNVKALGDTQENQKGILSGNLANSVAENAPEKAQYAIVVNSENKNGNPQLTDNNPNFAQPIAQGVTHNENDNLASKAPGHITATEPLTQTPAIAVENNVSGPIKVMKTQEELADEEILLSEGKTKEEAEKIMSDNASKTPEQLEIEAKEAAELTKFVQDEITMLILPEDDVMLGKLTIAAKLTYYEDNDFFKLFWDMFDASALDEETVSIREYIRAIAKKPVLLPKEQGLDMSLESVSRGDIPALRSILNHTEPDLIKIRNGNFDLLNHAIRKDNYNMVYYLIMRGSSINVADKDNALSPSVKWLLSRKVSN